MNYPYSPGYKTGGTSKESAEKIKPRAKSVREQVADLYAWHWNFVSGLTADEAARALNMSILTVRPRVTELVKQGKLVDSGIRRKNVSNHNAVVWKWADHNSSEQLSLLKGGSK